jgi:hypothetical protein
VAARAALFEIAAARRGVRHGAGGASTQERAEGAALTLDEPFNKLFPFLYISNLSLIELSHFESSNSVGF